MEAIKVKFFIAKEHAFHSVMQEVEKWLGENQIYNQGIEIISTSHSCNNGMVSVLIFYIEHR